MINLFVDPDEDIVVTINVAIDDKKHIYAWYDGQDKPIEVEDIKTEIFESVFREPSYRDSVELTDMALGVSTEGEISMSIAAVRMNRIIRLLKRWNLTDNNGDKVPSTPEMVEGLNPIVAQAISEGLEKKLGLSVEEIPTISDINVQD